MSRLAGFFAISGSVSKTSARVFCRVAMAIAGCGVMAIDFNHGPSVGRARCPQRAAVWHERFLICRGDGHSHCHCHPKQRRSNGKFFAHFLSPACPSRLCCLVVQFPRGRSRWGGQSHGLRHGSLGFRSPVMVSKLDRNFSACFWSGNGRVSDALSTTCADCPPPGNAMAGSVYRVRIGWRCVPLARD